MIPFSFTKILPILVFSFGIFNFCFAQEKFERETRISPGKVPPPAQDWLNDAFEKVKKPKWFLEFSQNGRSYEAKFRLQGYFYSVEFDSLGKIQDVEVEISQAEVASEIWKNIQSYFESEYDQIKVEKIQRQFSGSESDLEDYFDEGEKESVVIRYEIVFQAKQEIWEIWEATFDDSGKFLSKLKVQIRLNDNLIF